MATPGVYISAIGHTGLIGWLLLGWGLSADPLPFEIAEVSVVTSAEFDRLVRATTPDPDTAEPQAPVAPGTDSPPTPPVIDDSPAPAAQQPDAVTPPPTETPPPEAPLPPVEPADVTDTAPVLDAPPAPPPAAPDLPPSPRPQERPADRVTSEPVAPPPPDVDTAPVAQDTTAPAPLAPEVETPPADAAAAEASSSAIVPEDATPSGAVEASIRPAARPERPAPAAAPDPEAPAVDDSAVAAAVAEAQPSGAETPQQGTSPVGPPMNESEREGFRVAVNACWNVDPGSLAATVRVVVAFSLDRSGKVVGDAVRLVSSEGNESATRTAFEAARRAILRCQGQAGYGLPPEKYDHWKDVEITFDPSGMRQR